MAVIYGPIRSYDPDAADYFARIAAAGSSISVNNQTAVNSFIVGCKADGIWSAIKASCILAGADDLTGALVPLVGAAPTNFNFAAGDYSRTAGLVGNGSTKYLDSNRNNNTDPQNSQHLSCYATTIGSNIAISSAQNPVVAGTSHLGAMNVRSRNETASGSVMSAGFNGISRSSGVEYKQRTNNTTATIIQASQSPSTQSIGVLGTASFKGTSRLSFYSIGESLDLALLDARLTTLMSSLI